jgi:uncharacterized protein
MQVLILPGYGNSGPDHWQSHWEMAHPEFVRVQQKDWDNPRREDWLSAIDQAVSAAIGPIILVAHSLACLAVAHWGQINNRFATDDTYGIPPDPRQATELGTNRSRLQAKIRGALLVAPPDPLSPVFPPEAADFGPIPKGRLAFPGTIVYSANDPYATASFSQQCAREWHCETFFVGALGHINSASKLAMWPQGFARLEKMRAPE